VVPGVQQLRIGRVKRIFKWVVAEELVPPVVYQALAAECCCAITVV